MVLTAADWSNGIGHMVTTHFGLVSALFWAPRGPKRAIFGPKCPFWWPQRSQESPRGPNLVPTASSCSAWVKLMVTTHFGLVLALFWAPRSPKRAIFGPKCPFWGQNLGQKYFFSEYSHVGCLNRRNGTPWSFNATAYLTTNWKTTMKTIFL